MMTALKLIFIPIFIISYYAGKAVYKKYGSVSRGSQLNFKINAALASIFILCIAAAAFIRLTFDIEMRLPQIIRIHATHFKWFGVELLFVFIAAFAAGLYSNEPPALKRRLYITATGLLILFLSFEHYYTRPIYYLCSQTCRDGFVMQTFHSSCGPSALANLFILNGSKITEREAARAARTRYTGTTGDELALAAAKLDKKFFASYLKLKFEDIERLDLPCVLSFNEEHFITYAGKKKHLYEYIDPSTGICLARKKDLIKEWDGKALYIYPEKFDFIIKKGEKDDRLIKIKKAIEKINDISENNNKSNKESKTQHINIDSSFDETFETVLRRFIDKENIAGFRSDEITPYINLLILSRTDKAGKIKKGFFYDSQ